MDMLDFRGDLLDSVLAAMEYGHFITALQQSANYEGTGRPRASHDERPHH